MITFSNATFHNYLAAIERYPVLDRARENELARRYRAGDKAAGDLLVSASLRYVVKIAHGYRGYGLKLADLVSEGNLGLLKALSRYEPERGLRFMTYASYWVRAQILTFVLKHYSLVGIGTGPLQSKLFFRLQREKARILAEHGQDADATRILAERFGCSEERIRRMEQRIDHKDASLDACAYREGATTVLDTLASDEPDAEEEVGRRERIAVVRERIARAMARLDERERAIVRQRLLAEEGARTTLSDLGRSLGISRERVRQLEHRVKAKLRRQLADLGPDAPPRPLPIYAQAA